MKKCHYCDSAVPDSTDYCSVMCVSMAREKYLENAYPRRGRAADEELATLRAEVERLNKRLESEQHFIDSVCHYRNLAIVLGAKPEQMLGKFDRELCESGIDPNETSGGYHVSVNQQLDALKDVWAEVERLRDEVALLKRHLSGAWQDRDRAEAALKEGD